MNFKAKIYTKSRRIPFYKKWTLSEQISNTFFFIIILLAILNSTIDLPKEVFLSSFTKVLAGLMIIAFVFSIVYRFWEYEKINGRLEGEISFQENGIKIFEKLYLFSEIKNLHISYGNKYGDNTGNNRYGPTYSQGLNNYISFSHNDFFYKVYFQLYSTAQCDAIKEDLYYYVIHEVFPFEAKNLSFIDEKYHHYTDYKSFIARMKLEGKLS